MPAIDFETRRPWIVERLLTWPASGVLVATAGDAATGFLLLDTAAGHIDQLVVAPPAKGLGVARTLVAAAQALVPGSLVLDVNADNARAVRFYTRQGFRIESAGTNPVSGLPTWRMRALPRKDGGNGHKRAKR